jgi:OOP family OmpA-OmpF porin
MKQLKLLCVLTMLVLIGACSTTENRTMADSIGYVTDTGGHIWKSGFGDCWKHSGWTEASSHPDCGGSAPSPAPEPREETGKFWSDDQDRDGVLDASDRCPFTPEGIEVDSNGCALDADGDGVPDYLDKCPGTPAGTVVDTNGCGLALVKLSGIHFKFDSASLTADAKGILDRAISSIKANESQNLVVEGHTDSTGPDTYNLGLSQRRAKSVVNYLVSKGINGSRLNAKGLGENSPAASNATREGRAANRRVEIYAR